jgi:hypothetical protein
LNGTVVPATGTGVVGDWYMRTDTSDYYEKTGTTTWTLRGNLKGLTGNNGRGITSIARTSGTGAAGSTDTYTITYTDASTSTFTVVNGTNGSNGTAATVTVGTTTTLAAGSQATVTNSGTTSAAVLNFGIPAGADGSGGTGTATRDQGVPHADSYGWKAMCYDPVGISTGTIIGTTAVGTRIWLAAGTLITNIIVSLATAGATLTAGQNGAAIYSPTGALLGRTTDQSTAWTTASGRTMALVTPFTTSVDGYYDIVMWSNGTTKPTPHRSINLPVYNNNVTRAFTVTNITTTPPGTLGTKTQSSTMYWFAVS